MIYLTNEQAKVAQKIAKCTSQETFLEFLTTFCSCQQKEEEPKGRPVIPDVYDNINDMPDMYLVDQRIEELLNEFDQSMDDLPYPNEFHYAYDVDTRARAVNAAKGWHNSFATETVTYIPEEHTIKAGIPSEKEVMAEYICHLADVINKMETALVNVLADDEEEIDD